MRPIVDYKIGIVKIGGGVPPNPPLLIIAEIGTAWLLSRTDAVSLMFCTDGDIILIVNGEGTLLFFLHMFEISDNQSLWLGVGRRYINLH